VSHSLFVFQMSLSVLFPSVDLIVYKFGTLLFIEYGQVFKVIF